MMKVSKTLINLQPLNERVLFLLDRKVDMPIQLSWLEQLICNQQVVGSSPSIGSYLSFLFLGRYSSGQRGQTVNLLAQPSQVRILFSPQKTARIAQLARASAFQAEGREFESRLPLFFNGTADVAQGQSASLVRKRSRVQLPSLAHVLNSI